MKRCLIFAYHDINRDPRALRQIQWLSSDYEVHYICKIPDTNLNARFIKLGDNNYWLSKFRMILLILRMFRKYVWAENMKEIKKRINETDYDIIIAHHINLLPIISDLKGESCIILDAHEYYTEVYDDSLLWRVLMKPYHSWLAQNYLNMCDHIIAVNESMALRYKEEYKIKSAFITNAVDYEEQIPQPVSADDIKIIHHGLASPSRKIELMIEVMKYTDKRFSLTLVLLEINKLSELYVNKLKRLAAGNKRIQFVKPVAMKDVVSFGNKFDIGLFFMPPTNYNEEYSLANKVFQFVQSRLMLAVSPLPEMKKLVSENEIGIAAADYNPKTMADALNKLHADDVYRFKEMSHQRARQLSSEQNREKFINIVHSIQ